MDEILQRMLTVEREAEAILAAAEREAEKIRIEDKRAAQELEERLRRETAAAAADLIANRVAPSEEEKRTALEAAEVMLAQRATAFKHHVAAKRQAAKDAVAYIS